mmetsp:Transcript_5565/g.4715  ORF Transcript_5565/g.4715 Transcript_5565/m.4715 type:complete len:97 (-) Transcript_5565:1404-1694(-)|eukprot:CAMPEP_0114576428 /NCGR_PEP_ID=MMETSP0125-20121206/1192_1 /TAXON_ID=485358 ORGANISM="Aristerostoma sp., Strain ATCC 50986" /NCGR_SAMPLE_ID=MMETSP0125 /ASSEMBLY_ACC=CAM_ASM_000245 /LENGTH=96 /DNA_ID=CAMNT_0001764937 /DNA_START=481 /DNA_END=771 /DNA_ORIENTATION=-
MVALGNDPKHGKEFTKLDTFRTYTLSTFNKIAVMVGPGYEESDRYDDKEFIEMLYKGRVKEGVSAYKKPGESRDDIYLKSEDPTKKALAMYFVLTA